MIYIIYGLEQFFFGLCLYAIWLIVKTLFKAIVYSPLLFTGYIMTTKVLDRSNPALEWIILTLLFAFVLYQLIYFFKGIIVVMKARKNYLWVFLYMVCVGFTCVFPAWLFVVVVKDIIQVVSRENFRIISGMIAVVFGTFIYKRYLLLSDIAPSIAYPAYQMGIRLALRLH